MIDIQSIAAIALPTAGIIGTWFVLNEKVRKQGEELTQKIDRNEFEAVKNALNSRFDLLHADFGSLRDLILSAIINKQT